MTFQKIYDAFDKSAAECWRIESGGYSGPRQQYLYFVRQQNGIFLRSADNDYMATHSAGSTALTLGEALSKKWCKT